jgi:hypothetical protein
MMLLLVDTGFVFALADRSDAWHARARLYLQSTAPTLLAPATILPEVAYLLRNRIGADAERAFVMSLAAGELAVEDVTLNDWTRTTELLSVYDTIGMVDASIVAIAERLKLSTLATTDRRDFAIVRPAHVERLTLVP